MSQRLENWVRLRFMLAASDPMVAVIGAVGRLTDAGIDLEDATDIVLRVLKPNFQALRTSSTA